MPKNKLKPTDLTGNIFISFYRGLKLGLSNFLRNKFLSIATITVMAVIIFIFNIIIAIQFIGNQALQALSERVDIVLYLQDDISFYDANKFSEALSQIEGVKKVKYTSKEEALDIVAKTHPKTAEFLKKFDLKNPLPPSISIVTENAETQDSITSFLDQSEYKNLLQNYVSEGSSGESVILSSVAKTLANISHFVKQIIFWIVLVFVLGGTLVIVNAIQLTIFTRRNEIHIMRLVGATPNFIRLPFVFEGILYGLFAVALSFIMLVILGQNIQIEDSNLWSYYSNLQLDRVFISELAITIILGILSSFSAVQQYLKGKLTLN
jgi:cell division transport system permease protein